MIKFSLQKSFNIFHVRKMISKTSIKLFSSESNNACPINFQTKNEIYPHHFVF